MAWRNRIGIPTLRSFLGHRAGHFAIITALTAPITILAAAFAVDVGSNYVHHREVQSVTDLAAISAVANIGRPAEAALLTFADNGFPDISLADATGEAPSNSGVARIVVTPGRYLADPAMPSQQRFQPLAQPHDAVEVTYLGIGKRHFAGAISPPPPIATRAVATAHAKAAFSVGSRLAALEGGVANALLSGLTGSNVSLSAMDYNALLNADIDLLRVLDDLAIDLDLTAASFDQVLDTTVTMGQLADTMSRNDTIGGAAQAALSRLGSAIGLTRGETFRIGELVDAEIRHVSTGDVGVLDLVMASAAIAGAGKQVALDLGTALPGSLLSLDLRLGIGEPPQSGAWFGVGSQGRIVRTAQTRLGLVARIGGLGGLLPATIRVPLLLEVAYAEAEIDAISCNPRSVALKARPGIADLRLAEFDAGRLSDFSRPASSGPARLIDAALVRVRAQAHARIGNMAPERLTFSLRDIEDGRIRTVASRDFTTSLTQSLFSDLSVEVNVIGLGIGLPSGLSGTVGGLLRAAAPALDQVLNAVLDTLGLSLGQADLRVHDLQCQRAVLVQ